MNWTKDQQKIIDARDCNLLVSAAAGSGKTAVLVERIIQMVCDTDHPIDIDQLLVVTFTKAAASQMREKIAKAIEKKLEEYPESEHLLRQMNLVNRANIMTIDSFCFKVVKEHFYALGIDPNIRVGDTGEIALLREEVLEKVMEEFYEKNPDFVIFSDGFSADKNDDNIADYILRIYDVCASYPRPEYWVRQAREVLLITEEEVFSNLPAVKGYFEEVHATAQEIRERILKAIEQAKMPDGPAHLEKTFLEDIQIVDGIISSKTYTHFNDLCNTKFPRIATKRNVDFDRDSEEVLKKIRNKYKDDVTSLLAPFKVPFSQMLEQMQKQAPMLIALLDAVDAFREEFWKEKIAGNMLEFSDVEHCALQILCQGYEEDGTAIPSAIAKEMSEDFVEIMIDEYQDSNFLQEAILSCVSTMYQGKNNMFMVGDVKQSIYGFRMARPDIFMEKYHNYSAEDGADSRKLLLKNNFRSRNTVLEGINYIFYQIMGEDLGGIAYTDQEALVCGNQFPEGMDDTVELLIGESKDITILSEVKGVSYTGIHEERDADKNEVKDVETVEELDEKLEDIGKQELEANMVANRILEIIENQDGNNFVTDEKTRQLRPVQFSDIVILFRSPSSYHQVFYEVLMSKGIPVKVQKEKGYLNATEITMLLSLLKCIDNPYDDVEFVATLRGCFGNFTNDDLVYLTLLKRSFEKKQREEEGENSKKKFECLYDFMRWLCAPEKEDLIKQVLIEQQSQMEEFDQQIFLNKCEKIYSFIMRYMQQKSVCSIGELVRDLYQKEGYYHYVESMPEGEQRTSSLELFLGEANKCEKAGYCSLFQFLRFVDKIQKKSISLGGDAGMDSNENVVRIMSIHKSKGLEFPIVFVAGMGKQFNLMESKSPLIIHSDYFVGAKYRDTKQRVGNDTFLKMAMGKLIVTQNIAEELRVLYVALTRAKDKLIMTGVTSDITQLVGKFVHISERKERALSFVNVRRAKSYLDLIVMALMRNKAFEDAMKQVPDRLDNKCENTVSAHYERKVYLDEEDVKYKVKTYSFANLMMYHLKTQKQKESERGEQLYNWECMDATLVEKLKNALAWKYEQEDLSKQKSKLSVTEIKRIYETDYEPSDVVQMEKLLEYETPLPVFLAGEQKMDSATKGTWVHKTMELFDFTNGSDSNGIVQFLDEMIAQERIPKEILSFFSAKQIEELMQSSLGKRMKDAAMRGDLFKEKQFIVGVPVEKVLRKKEQLNHKASDCILVQGIIDTYFEENGQIVLIDYKTDYAKPGDEEKLVNRYTTQLQYYKDTLEQLTGMKVAETYIYSFSLNKAIAIL